MKHIARVFTFAATLAASVLAQTPAPAAPAAQDPLKELAAVIALEQQEGDLAKAEKGYREALAGRKLSTEGKQFATMRLAKLLRKLGRDKEAEALMAALLQEGPVATLDDVTPPAQDPAREAALREKAKALVEQILRGQGISTGGQSPVYLIEPKIAEQLLWVGQAAVPVVTGRLEEIARTNDGGDSEWLKQPKALSASALASFLWRVGGPQAAQFLSGASACPSPGWRVNFTRGIWQAQQPEMLDAAAHYLGDTSEAVFENLAFNPPVLLRMRVGQLIDAMRLSPPKRQAALLDQITQRMAPQGEDLEKLVQFVRVWLESADPEVGSAALHFLLSAAAQESVAGLELLLRELPRCAASNLLPVSQRQSPGMPPTTPRQRAASPATKKVDRFTKDEALRLLPKVTACAQAMGAVPWNALRDWLAQLMYDVAAPLDASVVPQALAWIDLGYRGAEGVLEGRITKDNLYEVFERLERAGNPAESRILGYLGGLDLPADLFPRLRALCGGQRRLEPREMAGIGLAMARTGNPEAAAWIVANGGGKGWSMEAALELGRRCHDEPVREAMRTLHASFAGTERATERGPLLLALLSLHDRAALDLVASMYFDQSSRPQPHPYATGDNAQAFTTPLRYLIEPNPNPPHGFTEDEVIGVLQKIAERGLPQSLEPRFFDVGRVPDRVVGELARLFATKPVANMNSEVRSRWLRVLIQRLDERRADGKAPGPLGDWYQHMLATDDVTPLQAVLSCLDSNGIAPLVPRLEALVDHEYEPVARRAAEVLEAQAGHHGLDWYKRLVRNRHSDLRTLGLEGLIRLHAPEAEELVATLANDANDELRAAVANHFGAVLDKERVPMLLTMLRDPIESVRKAATESLTRIRFFHEQQAHWDRVLKGLDASPATAAEKLLLQARPGAPRAQRLLAIPSLGALGAPEALPFLIEWTNDADAEIAAAAKAAVLQIHQNPRR